MKSFLSRTILWGTALILLQNGEALAKPIQLLPQTGETPVVEPQVDNSLSSSQDLSEFWEGTPPSIITTYFPKLPLRLNSPLLRKLRTQIGTEVYTDLLQNTIYEKVLLSLLTEAAIWEKAKELLMETDLPEKEALLLDLQWLGGNQKKACEKISNLIRTSSQAEWKKQNIYCLYLNGEEERAKISAEVLRESDPSGAQPLNMLFDASSQPPFEQSIGKSPFLLTVWLESKQDIPTEAFDKLSSSSLALIARSDKAPWRSRLLACEKALQQGTYKAEDFLTLLKEAPEKETGQWGDILGGFASLKTEDLLPLFEQAEKEKKLELIARVFKEALTSIAPSLETLPLAPFMIRAFLQTEEKALANKWGTFFMREAPDEAVAILPLLHFASPAHKWEEPQIQAWQAYESRVHPETATQRSYEIRHILEAFAEPAGNPMKGEPSPLSWRQEKALFDGQEMALLEAAAASKRKGEVLLLVLILLGETPLQGYSVDRLVPILKALDKTGYKDEARTLALEFLLAKEM